MHLQLLNGSLKPERIKVHCKIYCSGPAPLQSGIEKPRACCHQLKVPGAHTDMPALRAPVVDREKRSVHCRMRGARQRDARCVQSSPPRRFCLALPVTWSARSYPPLRRLLPDGLWSLTWKRTGFTVAHTETVRYRYNQLSWRSTHTGSRATGFAAGSSYAT